MRPSSARQRGVDEAGRDVEADGSRPDLARLPAAQRVLALQRMAGNRAVSALVARTVTDVSQDHVQFSFEEEDEEIEQPTVHAEPEADYSGVAELFAEPEAVAE